MGTMYFYHIFFGGIFLFILALSERQSDNQGKRGIYHKSQGFQGYHRSQASERQNEEYPTFKSILIFPWRYNYGDYISMNFEIFISFLHFSKI